MTDICIHGVADARICVNCLSAEIERLRAALGDKYRAMQQVHFDRAAVIEECCRVVEQSSLLSIEKATVMAALRALKDKAT